MIDTQEEFRDHLSTLDDTGKRKWMYPRKPAGRYYNWRKITSYLLLVILFGVPFIKWEGEPLFLFNILERRFILFGQVFWPQDFHLFVIAMITLLVFIILFTVIYGRLFCGWVCPQTIFMEMVFRRIEYWIEGDYTAQQKLNKSPWTSEKIWKKGTKHAIFLAISILIMHTFMAYLVGVDRVQEIITSSPTENLGGFTAMIFFSGMFYLVFGRIREQVCTNICPYGRLQGVLLDKDSIIVAYDYRRGESRKPLRKEEDRLAIKAGDCIDCKQCVQVCPTGIDIRNGTQLECVNCTACIDACDNIMDRIGFKRGLIRYASEQNISLRSKNRFTPRMAVYSSILILLIGVLTVLIAMRADIETTILRTPGMTYQSRPDGTFTNLYNYKVVNKTNKEKPIKLELVEGGQLELVGGSEVAQKQSIAEGAFFIALSPDQITDRKTKLHVNVYAGDDLVEVLETSFMGPYKTKSK